MKPNPIPSNYPQLTPAIAVRDGAAAITFYQKALGAKVRMCMKDPSGKVAHAELEIGTGLLMLADKFEGYNHTPDDLKASTVTFNLYVEDVDAAVARAVEQGATLLFPVKDQFYGDRSGRVRDPFGHVWILSSHIEDVSPEEMDRRMAKCAQAG
jgi:PhnB protein